MSHTWSKKRLYLIETVYSSGPISLVRLVELKKFTEKCKVNIVYVIAFLDRETFKKFVKDLA
jgi:type II restriction enzyme